MPLNDQVSDIGACALPIEQHMEWNSRMQEEFFKQVSQRRQRHLWAQLLQTNATYTNATYLLLTSLIFSSIPVCPQFFFTVYHLYPSYIRITPYRAPHADRETEKGRTACRRPSSWTAGSQGTPTIMPKCILCSFIAFTRFLRRHRAGRAIEWRVSQESPSFCRR
jgi:hypothetical protein